jgi:hypothetical protein
VNVWVHPSASTVAKQRIGDKLGTKVVSNRVLNHKPEPLTICPGHEDFPSRGSGWLSFVAPKAMRDPPARVWSGHRLEILNSRRSLPGSQFVCSGRELLTVASHFKRFDSLIAVDRSEMKECPLKFQSLADPDSERHSVETSGRQYSRIHRSDHLKFAEIMFYKHSLGAKILLHHRSIIYLPGHATLRHVVKFVSVSKSNADDLSTNFFRGRL